MLDELLVELMSYDLSPEALDCAARIVEQAGQSNLGPFQGTVMCCHRCCSISSYGYDVRRMGNKYVLLCRGEDGGCSAKELLPQCQYLDQDGIQCTQCASHYLSPNFQQDPESPSNKHACIRHIGALLGDYPNVLVGQHT